MSDDEARTGEPESRREAASDRAEASRLGAVALLLAASVLLSRVSGYVRDLVLANRVGTGAEADAYFIAFLLPDLLNYLLAGGALSIAFIPLYSRVRDERGETAAGRLFETVLGNVGLLAVAGTVLLWIAAEEVAGAQLDGFDAETRALTVRLARIMLPAQVFFITGGILRAVLMAHGRFGAQAAAPLLYNGAMIAGGLVTGSAEGFAWGVLAGAFLGNWLVPLLDLRKVRSVGLRISPLDARFREYLVIALPLMLGISLATVDEWYEKFLGAALDTGSVSYLGYARKLMMAPVAVVGQAIGAAALPVLSQLWSRGAVGELNDALLGALRGALALGILAGAACWVFSVPLVELLFHHGRFSAEAAVRVAHLLGLMSLAVPAWVFQQVLVRAFFARGDTWRPMLLGTGVALAVIPLYLLLRSRMGVEGLALAGVVAMTANALATLAWARSRHGAPPLDALLGTLVRTGGIALAAAACAAFAQLGLEGRTGALIDLALGGAVFGGVALAGTWWLGDEALRAVLNRIVARLVRSRSAGQ